MVYFRRKPLKYASPPEKLQNDSEVWVIQETGEVFSSYESFLGRRNFYDQRKFSDKAGGQGNLTFWDALKHENENSRDVDLTFPEPLREPILKKVNMSTFPRLDDLVKSIWEDYKDNILPGEEVLIHDPQTGNRMMGKLREKIFFEATKNKPSFTRFFVILQAGTVPSTVIVDTGNIQRSRQTFTKYSLNKFFKAAVMRERYDGAPWQVKDEFARLYGIDNRVPENLTQQYIQNRKKDLAAQKRAKDAEEHAKAMAPTNGTAPKSSKRKKKSEGEDKPPKASRGGQSGKTKPEAAVEPPPPPPIKYPIEDLEVGLAQNGNGGVIDGTKLERIERPTPALFTDSDLFLRMDAFHEPRPYAMDSMTALLEVWNTLNVFGEFFKLSGFTFDDFAGAMFIASPEFPCELFTEMHCAVLKRLMDSEGNWQSKTLQGLAKKHLKDKDSSETGSEDGSEEDEDMEEASDADEDENMDTAPEEQSDSAHDSKMHFVDEALEEIDWREMLQSRQFKDQDWTIIVAGLLDLLSHADSFKTPTAPILQALSPPDLEASTVTIKDQYTVLNTNLRVQVLQMLTMLVLESKGFKEYTETIIKDQTETRNRKTEIQKQRKPLVKELFDLQQQKALLRPDDYQEDTEAAPDATADSEDSEDGADEEGDTQSVNGYVVNGDNEASSNDEDDVPDDAAASKGRRVSGRATILKRKREEQEQAEEEAAAAAAAKAAAAASAKKAKEANSEHAEFQRVLDEINRVQKEIAQCDKNIGVYNHELRENSCYRTTCMGRDRFLNRYWWYERNGMPEDGNTEYGYANGRLWIQGPDVIEAKGILDAGSDMDKKNRESHNMGIAERRQLEEGSCQLGNATEWGYYDDPADLGRLVEWLDERGERERALRREIKEWQPNIEACMKAVREYKALVAEQVAALESRQVGIATRKKRNEDVRETKYPCLTWHNAAAMEKIGRLHVDGMPPPKKGGRRADIKAAAAASNRSRETSVQPAQTGRAARGGGRKR